MCEPEVTTNPADVMRQFSAELEPARVGELVDELKCIVEIGGADCPAGLEFCPIVEEPGSIKSGVVIGKVTVALAEDRSMVLSDLLDINWEQRADGVISRIGASAIDITGKKHPPLDVSESQDDGEVFRHFRPFHSRSQSLLGIFLSDLVTIHSMVGSYWNPKRVS